MPQSRRMRRIIAAIVLAAFCGPAGSAADDVTFTKLLVITRSKNANEVHYDARVRRDGSLDPKQPVTSYWINKAEGGGRGPITFFQRFAYGYSAKRSRDGHWTFELTAFKERPMSLVKTGLGWRAQASVAGRQAYLRSLFVATDESGWMPKVLYVEAFGDDAATGAPLQEHLVRK